ncbi:YsnF/AvaK domain-containing protein [Sphingomonas sp.]|jgi:uncharacterized protein (TIGR02271 family)|uniref:YsnF/AvaK domain-containing protein n=1 Tax=Sphingomonas sp. TaxID=28214 RepID=UPI002D809144|nr:YsnF/AvaK domain-containing protein [Sphingomonas sp.]HEU0043086.1 YsnF/AvaK domain-containing protein [Sphingomonas sp.]
MSSTITALFDTRAEAEAAKARLESASFDTDNVHVHDQSSQGFRQDAYSTHQDRGVWGSIKNAFLPDEDRHTYEEGIRRGGALLTADVHDDKVDDAVRILEEANSVDIDDRSQQWRQSGWDYAGAGTSVGGATTAAGLFGARDRDTTTGSDREEVIPIVEEQLVVGKREVSRGGARVRSYVTETPVHEQVRLREENIDVQRRRVDQPLSAADGDAFQERTIDVTATGEEAVVAKNARVVEEVVVSKTVGERTEDVSDTVRHTEVEIDRDNATTTGTTGYTDRDGMGGTSGKY